MMQEKKIKNSTKNNSREILIYLFCVLIACGMWFLKNIGTEHDVALNVAVTYLGVPDYVEFDEPLPKKIQIVLHEKGRGAVQYAYQRLEIMVDLSGQIKGDEGEINITNAFLRQQVAKLLKDETKLLHITPEVISRPYHQIITEKVFTVPITTENVPAREQLHLFPTEVTVTVQVGMNHFPEVLLNNVQAVCEYPTDNTPEKLEVHVKTNSPYVLSTRVVPNEVDFLIEQR